MFNQGKRAIAEEQQIDNKRLGWRIEDYSTNQIFVRGECRHVHTLDGVTWIVPINREEEEFVVKLQNGHRFVTWPLEEL